MKKSYSAMSLDRRESEPFSALAVSGAVAEPKVRARRDEGRRILGGAGLARFMELRGHPIAEACGVLWHRVDGGFYMSLPYQAQLDPDPTDLERMLRATRAVGVRFPSRTWLGLPSGVYVCQDKNYGLRSVHPKHRSRVRRGLERFEVRPAGIEELLAQGRQLNLDTMQRQGRYDREFGQARSWKRLVEAIGQCPGVQAVGAFAGPRLAAYIINCREDRCLNILHQMSRREDLNNCPNHALSYEVTRQLVQDPELECICYGSVSLIPAEGLHQYKVRFGYEVQPHYSAFQLHPLLAPMLGRPAAGMLVGMFRRLWPRDQRLERVEMTLRGVRQSGGTASTEGGHEER